MPQVSLIRLQERLKNCHQKCPKKKENVQTPEVVEVVVIVEVQLQNENEKRKNDIITGKGNQMVNTIFFCLKLPNANMGALNF